MLNILVPLIFLSSAAIITFRVFVKKLPRVCLAYAAGIAIIAVCALGTGKSMNICATAPLFVLASSARRNMRQSSGKRVRADDE